MTVPDFGPIVLVTVLAKIQAPSKSLVLASSPVVISFGLRGLFIGCSLWEASLDHTKQIAMTFYDCIKLDLGAEVLLQLSMKLSSKVQGRASDIDTYLIH